MEVFCRKGGHLGNESLSGFRKQKGSREGKKMAALRMILLKSFASYVDFM